MYVQAKLKARLLTGPLIAERQCKSEFGRQVAVDLKADTDLNECWRIPSHVLLLMHAASKLLHWAAAQKGALLEKFLTAPGLPKTTQLPLRGACHVRWQRWAKLANRLQGRGLMHSVAVAAAPSPYARATRI